MQGWYVGVGAFARMLSVFLDIFSSCASPEAMANLKKKLSEWRSVLAMTIRNRALVPDFGFT